MQRIYIDVTYFLSAKFLTGTQRVVNSVSKELIKLMPEKVCFVIYDSEKKGFREVDFNSKSFVDDRVYGPKDLNPGDVFFDLDAVWNNTYKRSVLYPQLKHYGIKIAVYVYDIIPITHPQFAHAETRFNFMNFVGAYLQYADILIASAQSTLDEIGKLEGQLGLSHVNGYVSWLGSDFSEAKTQISKEKVPEKVVSAAKGKYVLSVGTIEPRKNHKLLLDAFDDGLFDRDVKLIFAGKAGWNIDEISSRMEKHQRRDEDFFWFTGLSDEAIEYLYQNAYLVAFPSFTEGFGLPIVESLERGTPVIAADVPILREVGKDYCEYFDPKDFTALKETIERLLDERDAYEKLQKKALEFSSFSWEEVAKNILNALNTLKPAEYKAKTSVRQMVLLTARVEDIEKTIPFIEEYMPFIEKMLLCCPQKVSADMQAIKTKRILLETLTDEELLQGRELPEDHGTRNFFLRCLAMGSSKVDEVFIMSDDDYRPLRKITIDQYVRGDSYRAYYCHDLNEWRGVVGNITSYDRYVFRTRDFVNENKYPGYQYSSHMPQIIDKALYQEMISKHPGIEMMGLDEWSSYFNYVQAMYPDLIISEPYVTMCWPGKITDWNMYVEPSEYVFENHYGFLYQKGEVFENLSETLSEKQSDENAIKIEKIKEITNNFFNGKRQYSQYCGKMISDSLEVPSFGIYCKENIEIAAPSEVELAYGCTSFLPFVFKGDKEGLMLQLAICQGKNTLVQSPYIKLNLENLALTDGRFETLVVCPEELKKGNYTLEIRVEGDSKKYEKRVALKVV